jgi:hypothetical protein
MISTRVEDAKRTKERGKNIATRNNDAPKPTKSRSANSTLS